MQTHLRNARVFSGGVVRAVLLLGVGAIGLHAQVEPDSGNSGEVTAYTGFAAGGIGTHALVGASSGLFVNRYGALLIGGMFVPMGSNTVVPNTNAASRSHLYDASLTLNIQIPISNKWAPYGLAATSLLYNTYQLQLKHPDRSVYQVGASEVKFAFETGGGVRYYVSDDWGVKAEYRYAISTQNFSQFAFGIFYRLPSSWPFSFRARSN